MASSVKSATFKVVVDNLRFVAPHWDFVLPRGEYQGEVEYFHLVREGREILQEVSMFIFLTREEIVLFGGTVSQNLNLDGIKLDVLARVQHGDIECHPI